MTVPGRRTGILLHEKVGDACSTKIPGDARPEASKAARRGPGLWLPGCQTIPGLRPPETYAFTICFFQRRKTK